MKKSRVGIVGLGRLGFHHAQDLMFRIPEVELVAACSIVPAELEKVASWGLEGVYSDYSEMIQKANLDAVFIVSISSVHAEQIMEAMEAGLHVFSEKPMGVSLEECEKVEKCVEAHPELKFQLGFMRRFDPSYMEAKRRIEAGELGKPFLFKSTSNDPLATIDGFLNYAPHSGGPWLDMSVHDIDLALWFLGSEVETIYAIGGGYLYPELEKCGCADNACALLKFKNGAMAQMHVGYSSPHGYQVETEIYGEGKNIRISAVPAKNRIQTYNRDGVLVECDPSWPLRFNEAFLAEKQEFIKCVIEDRTPTVGAKDGTASTRVALAATKAFETGELVHL